MKDYEADIACARSYIGYGNAYFESIFDEFARGMWDGVPCSEIACCFSYLAGNLNKILVSNYAQGLVDLYSNAGRFGHTPELGAFIWFDYGDGNGPSHTGRVVDYDDYTVYTVEGNVGGIVQALSYPRDSYLIYGYGYPYYTDEEMPGPSPPGPQPGPDTDIFIYKNRKRRRKY